MQRTRRQRYIEWGGRRAPLNEPAIMGLNLLKHDGWVEVIAPGTELEVRVSHPATAHLVSVAQLRR